MMTERTYAPVAWKGITQPSKVCQKGCDMRNAGPPRLLCVDDEPNVLDGLKRILRHRYQVTCAKGGTSAIEVLRNNGPFAVMMADLLMPGMNGVALLEQARGLAPDTIRILLTGQADLPAAIDAVNQGNVFRFLTKPCSSGDLFQALDESIEQYRLVNAERVLQFTETMMASLDARDCYTAAHSNRVSFSAVVTAEAMGISPAQVEIIRIGAKVHDIGKIGIPDAVLRKPGKLTEEELDVMRLHPQIGKRILERVDRFHDYLPIVELHHENYDGSGYPYGLKRDQVPREVRIVHVADVFDAVTSGRTYRPSLSEDQALKLLQVGSGRLFDPVVVEAFTEILRSRRVLNEILESEWNHTRA